MLSTDGPNTRRVKDAQVQARRSHRQLVYIEITPHFLGSAVGKRDLKRPLAITLFLVKDSDACATRYIHLFEQGLQFVEVAQGRYDLLLQCGQQAFGRAEAAMSLKSRFPVLLVQCTLEDLSVAGVQAQEAQTALKLESDFII